MSLLRKHKFSALFISFLLATSISIWAKNIKVEQAVTAVLTNALIEPEIVSTSTGQTVTGLNIGFTQADLKAAVKSIPKTKVNKKLTVKDLRLEKVEAEGNDAMKVHVKGVAAYKASVLKGNIAFKLRFIVSLYPTTKKARIHSYKLKDAKLKGSSLGIPVKGIAKDIVKSFAKDKTVSAAKVFSALSALSLNYEGVKVTSTHVYFIARTTAPKAYDTHRQNAIASLKTGDYTSAQSHWQQP